MRVRLVAPEGDDRRKLEAGLLAAGHVLAAEGDDGAGLDAVVVDGTPGSEAVRLATEAGGAGAPVIAGITDVPGGAATALQLGAADVYPAGDAAALLVRLAALEAGLISAEAAAEAASDPLYRLSLDGTVLWVNRATEELLGYRREELVGKPAAFLVRDPEEAARVAEELRAKAEGRVAASLLELNLRTAGGEELPAAVTSRVVFRNGRPWTVEGMVRDLRPRRELERRVRQEAELFARLGVAAVATDREGRVISWNREAERLFGRSEAEMRGQVALDVVTPDARRVAERALAQLVAGEDVTVEVRMWRADGSAFPGLVRATVLRDPHGAVVGLVGAVVDLTAERERQRQLERLADVVSASEDAVTAYDLDGRITEWNAAAERIYGLRAEEAIGRLAWELAPEEERVSHRELVERVLRGETIAGQVVRRDDGRGLDGYLSLSAFPIRDADGRTVGAASVTRDVTALVEAEREVSWLAAIVASANDAVVGRDTEGRIVSWNAAAERMFGYSAEEMIGTFGEATTPAERLDEYRGLLFDVEATVGLRIELLRRHRNGRVFPVRAVTFPVFDRAGRRLGSASVLRDITEERAVREALEQRERQLRALFESAGEAIIVVDRERRVRWLNRFAAEVAEAAFGRRPVPGEPIAAFIAERDRAAWDEAFDAALCGRATVRLGRVDRRDGSRMWYEMTFRPVTDESGAVTAVALVGRDVTDRRLAERALREREATLRSIFESTRDHLWLLDREGRLVTCNGVAAAFARAQFGREARPGDPMMDFADAESRGLLARAIAEAVAGKTLQGEVKTTRPGGEALYFDILVSPVRDDREEVTGVVITARDVTEQARARRGLQRAREALEREYAKLATIIENSDEGVVLLDPECRIVAFNTEFAEGTLQRRGVRPQLGMHFREAVSQESAEMLLARVREALAGRRVAFEVQSKSPGRRRWFEVRIRPVVSPAGEVTGVVYTGRDVTERQEQQQRLEEALADLSATFGAIHEGVALLGGNGEVLAVNPAAQELVEDLFGVRVGPGMSWREAVPAGLHEAFAEVIAKTMAGETSNFEYAVTDRNGKERWLELSFGRVEMSDGSVRGVALGISDVTERKRTEERLLQAQKAESLAVLAGGIAHDFNNLLVGILGNAGLALAELPPDSPVRETIRDIEVAGQRAAELARQMLAYAGRGKVSTGTVDLNGLVEKMTHLLRTSVGAGVHLVLDLAGGLPPVVGDATQIRQVVMNLVINASDAIGGGEGVVRVSTRRVPGSEDLFMRAVVAPGELAAQYVVLEVADTGSGMDEATLSRIFDPFFTTKFAGRGLGLAAVLGIVRGHRGGIAVESRPGAGTRFRVMLPAHDGAGPAARERAEEMPWRGSGLVIVADDEQSVRAVTARALRAMGFEVLEAEDGAAAVQLFREHQERVALVLLDMTMPRMNGAEAFRAIREADPGARVVMMSGYSEQDATDRLATEGLAGFLQKPYELATLQATVRRVLEGGAA